jgi:outer membrane lipoprotein-sorting protein
MTMPSTSTRAFFWCRVNVAKTLIVAAALAAATWSHGAGAAADACAPIVKAELATATAPAFRQYMSLSEGKGERSLSIALGNTVYMAIGGQAGWQKMDRTEIIALAKEAADDADYRDCRSLGSETIGGVDAAVYQFTMASKSDSFAPSRAKAWIGADGLLRKQATDKGSFRYEFDDVKAPIP